MQHRDDVQKSLVHFSGKRQKFREKYLLPVAYLSLLISSIVLIKYATLIPKRHEGFSDFIAMALIPLLMVFFIIRIRSKKWIINYKVWYYKRLQRGRSFFKDRNMRIVETELGFMLIVLFGIIFIFLDTFFIHPI